MDSRWLAVIIAMLTVMVGSELVLVSYIAYSVYHYNAALYQLQCALTGGQC